MDIDGKGLEPVGQLHGNDAQSLHGFQDGLVVGKAHIDHVAPLGDHLAGEGFCKQTETLQLRHLKHHVVSQPDMIQDLIQTGDPGIDSFKCFHGLSS